jgi:hypothetical protein
MLIRSIDKFPCGLHLRLALFVQAALGLVEILEPADLCGHRHRGKHTHAHQPVGGLLVGAGAVYAPDVDLLRGVQAHQLRAADIDAVHGIERADDRLPDRRMVGDYLPGPRVLQVEFREFATVDGLNVLLGIAAERPEERLLRGLLRDAELAADGGEREVPQA